MKTTAVLCLLLAALVPLARAEEGVPENPNNPVAVIKTSLGDVHIELFVREAPKTVQTFLGLAEGTKPFKDPTTGQDVKRPYYDGLTFHRVIRGFMIQGGCPQGTGRGSPGFQFEDEIDADALGLGKKLAFDEGRPHGWLNIGTQEDLQQKVIQPLAAKMGVRTREDFQQRWPEIRARIDTMSIKDVYELWGYSYLDGVGAHAPKKGTIAMANAGPDTNGSQFFLTLADVDRLSGKHTVFGRILQGMDVVEKIGAVKTGVDDKPLQAVKIVSIRRRPAR